MVSVNGHEAPASLDVPGGREQLFRIVNATSDSPKLLALKDAAGVPVPMRVVELDGIPVSGDAEHPLSQFTTTTSVMLSPAARAGILLAVPSGQTVTLSSEHFCEGPLAFYVMPQRLLRITGTAAPGQAPAPREGGATTGAPQTPASKLVAFARAHPSLVHRRAITFSQYIFPKHGTIPPHSSYFLTDTTDPKFREHAYYPVYRMDQAVPRHADVVVKRGTLEEWYLFNTTMESHTFHIHQMAFVELDGPGGSPATVDSTFVPVGTLLPNPSDPDYPLVKPSVTKVLLDFRNVPRGTFVFHCHMLFHEDRGMMGVIRVE
jgi:FtsP/CotA-like multicopper oxidase with cupredoxin domain